MMGNAQEHTRKCTEQRKERKSKSAHKDRERGKTVNFYRKTKSLHSFSESSRFSSLGLVGFT